MAFENIRNIDDVRQDTQRDKTLSRRPPPFPVNDNVIISKPFPGSCPPIAKIRSFSMNRQTPCKPPYPWPKLQWPKGIAEVSTDASNGPSLEPSSPPEPPQQPVCAREHDASRFAGNNDSLDQIHNASLGIKASNGSPWNDNDFTATFRQLIADPSSNPDGIRDLVRKLVELESAERGIHCTCTAILYVAENALGTNQDDADFERLEICYEALLVCFCADAEKFLDSFLLEKLRSITGTHDDVGRHRAALRRLLTPVEIFTRRADHLAQQRRQLFTELVNILDSWTIKTVLHDFIFETFARDLSFALSIPPLDSSPEFEKHIFDWLELSRAADPLNVHPIARLVLAAFSSIPLSMRVMRFYFDDLLAHRLKFADIETSVLHSSNVLLPLQFAALTPNFQLVLKALFDAGLPQTQLEILRLAVVYAQPSTPAAQTRSNLKSTTGAELPTDASILSALFLTAVASGRPQQSPSLANSHAYNKDYRPVSHFRRALNENYLTTEQQSMLDTFMCFLAAKGRHPINFESSLSLYHEVTDGLDCSVYFPNTQTAFLALERLHASARRSTDATGRAENVEGWACCAETLSRSETYLEQQREKSGARCREDRTINLEDPQRRWSSGRRTSGPKTLATKTFNSSHSFLERLNGSDRDSHPDSHAWLPVGLRNRSNNCFANAVLQCFFCFPELVTAILNCDPSSYSTLGKSMMETLQTMRERSVHASMIKDRDSGKWRIRHPYPQKQVGQHSQATSDFDVMSVPVSAAAAAASAAEGMKVAEVLPKEIFPPGCQADASEFARFCFHHANVDGKDSFFSHFFGGALRESVQCAYCNFVSMKTVPFLDLSVTLHPNNLKAFPPRNRVHDRKGANSQAGIDPEDDPSASGGQVSSSEESCALPPPAKARDRASTFSRSPLSEEILSDAGKKDRRHDITTEFAADTDKRKITLQKLVDDFFTPELFKGSNRYQCEQCGKKRRAIRMTNLEQAPFLLMVTISRFSWDVEAKCQKKECFPVCISPQLTLRTHTPRGRAALSSCYTSEKTSVRPSEDARQLYRGREAAKYRLVAALMHNGASADSGHYVTLGSSGALINPVKTSPSISTLPHAAAWKADDSVIEISHVYERSPARTKLTQNQGSTKSERIKAETSIRKFLAEKVAAMCEEAGSHSTPYVTFYRRTQ